MNALHTNLLDLKPLSIEEVDIYMHIRNDNMYLISNKYSRSQIDYSLKNIYHKLGISSKLELIQGKILTTKYKIKINTIKYPKRIQGELNVGDYINVCPKSPESGFIDGHIISINFNYYNSLFHVIPYEYYEPANHTSFNFDSHFRILDKNNNYDIYLLLYQHDDNDSLIVIDNKYKELSAYEYI